MLKIDSTDPFFIIYFLQFIYTNYLNHVKQNNRQSHGDPGQKWLLERQNLQQKYSRIQTASQLHSGHDEPSLNALHTIIRSKYNDSLGSVTFTSTKREVTSILNDKSRPGGISFDILREDPVASMATVTFYAQKELFQPRGGFQGNQSCSPISKPKAAKGRFRIPASAWKAMSEAE